MKAVSGKEFARLLENHGWTLMRVHGSHMETLIRYAICPVVLAIWTILGLFFWPPLLARTIAAFCLAVLYSSLTGANAEHLREPLDAAIGFYSRGFSIILDTLFSDSPSSVNEAKHEFKLEQVLAEFLWAGIFWVTILYAIISLM